MKRLLCFLMMIATMSSFGSNRDDNIFDGKALEKFILLTLISDSPVQEIMVQKPYIDYDENEQIKTVSIPDKPYYIRYDEGIDHSITCKYGTFYCYRDNQTNTLMFTKVAVLGERDIEIVDID